jgi:hypothetical protein
MTFFYMTSLRFCTMTVAVNMRTTNADRTAHGNQPGTSKPST